MARSYAIFAVFLHLAAIVSATPFAIENDNHAASDLDGRIASVIVCDGGLNYPACMSGGAYHCRCDYLGTYLCDNGENKKACTKCGCQ